MRLAVLLISIVAEQLSAQDSTLHLPLRVHLLSSMESQALSTTRTPAQIEQMLAVANRIWAQAHIQFRLELVVSQPARNGATFDSLIASTIPATRPTLLSVFPRDSLLVPGWNLFLIRDYGQIGGGSFFTEIRGVVLAERGMGIDLLPNERGGGTLAHELGHSLGLPHQPCDERRNIMAIGCWKSAEVMTLTPEQITTARRQAVRGSPITVEPDWRSVPPNKALQQSPQTR